MELGVGSKVLEFHPTPSLGVGCPCRYFPPPAHGLILTFLCYSYAVYEPEDSLTLPGWDSGLPQGMRSNKIDGFVFLRSFQET